jgi:hypothetical protein
MGLIFGGWAKDAEDERRYGGSRGNGGWSTHCSQDSRFNLSGRATGCVGASKAMDDAVLAKQRELGLSDAYMDSLTIEIGFCKD